MDTKLKAIFKKPLFEIIDECCQHKERRDKVDTLRRYESPSLRNYLCFLFDPKLTFNQLPRGTPPFRSSANPTNIDTDTIRFEAHRHLFPDQRGEPPFVFFLTHLGRGNMSPSVVQSHFERLIRACHPKDNILFVAMKDKKPPIGITRKVVAEAFPDLEQTWAPEVAEPDKRPRGRPPKVDAPAPAPAPAPPVKKGKK